MRKSRILGIAFSPFTLSASWLLLAGMWLASTQDFGNLGLSRVVATTTLLLSIGFLWRLGRNLWRPESRPWGPLFIGLLLVAAGVGFTGLEHEVGSGYYTDEGHYLHHAQRVASGELFTGSMIYPHLLYYLDAFALWLSELFPGLTLAVAKGLYGVEIPRHIPWLVLRWVGALLAVTATIPVALVARGLAGTLGGLAAGGAMIFASQFNEGFHVNTCDVPSAAFAAWCLFFVFRLQKQESYSSYLGAGICAGLAAATKYPAGFVAVAIVAVWLFQRIRHRDWHWGLITAGATALATFLALNPSFFVYPEATLFGKRGLWFGVRQYSGGGWIGVMPSSKAAYYWQQLQVNFGLPIVGLALTGLLGLDRPARRCWLELTIFPVVYFMLISSMNMVVVRNLFPAIPAFALLFGAAAAGWQTWFRSTPPVLRVTFASVLLCLAWVQPARSTLTQTAAMTRPSTREAMTDWIHQNLPRGAGILKESYTPNFSPEWYLVREQRFALKFPAARFEDPQFDFLLLASQAHGRFFRPEHQTFTQADWYRDAFKRFPMVHEEPANEGRLGPHLYLLRLEREPKLQDKKTFLAQEAFLTQAAMTGTDEGSVTFERPANRAIFSEEMIGGKYEALASAPDGSEHQLAKIVVFDLTGHEIKNISIRQNQPTLQNRPVIDLPADGKYFFSVQLPAGSRLARFILQPIHSPESAP